MVKPLGVLHTNFPITITFWSGEGGYSGGKGIIVAKAPRFLATIPPLSLGDGRVDDFMEALLMFILKSKRNKKCKGSSINIKSNVAASFHLLVTNNG